MGIRLGLFQESNDHFQLTIDADAGPKHLVAEFDADDLQASISQQRDGSTRLSVDRLSRDVAEARNMVLRTLQSEEDGTVEGGVMALDTATDWWSVTLLRKDMPSYHVALTFALIPLEATIVPDGLLFKPYELAGRDKKIVSWRMVQPALLTQCAKIFYQNTTTGADACALLANRDGVLDYLAGLGETFSLSDIEQLVAFRQLATSCVVAAAVGLHGEDAPWIYQMQLSQRAVEDGALLPVSYARAKSRHVSGLRSYAVRPGLSEDQLEYHQGQVDRFAHHLAVLELCQEYGIGLWSAPLVHPQGVDAALLERPSWGQHLAVAVSPERK